jgi:hypothetical protein
MGLMNAPWDDMVPAYTEAASKAVIRCFSGIDASKAAAQAIANIIYSCGVSGVVWSQCDRNFKQALIDGIQRWGAELKGQEVSILIYGLGSMKTAFSDLPAGVVDALSGNIGGLSDVMIDAELCELLHGLAKMNAKWSEIDNRIVYSIYKTLIRLGKIDAICLTCTVYSLGMLEAGWENLPREVRMSLTGSITGQTLVDQALSNVIYGLSLMQVEWSTMDPLLRSSICRYLENDKALAVPIPQHTANTIW